MAKQGTEEIEIRRTTTDRYGDVTDDIIVARATKVLLWPRAGGGRDTGRGIVTIEGYHVWVPTGKTVWEDTVAEADRKLREADDVILTSRNDPRRYHLEGAVGDWRNKRGNRLGFLFEVKRRAS